MIISNLPPPLGQVYKDLGRIRASGEGMNPDEADQRALIRLEEIATGLQADGVFAVRQLAHTPAPEFRVGISLSGSAVRFLTESLLIEGPR